MTRLHLVQCWIADCSNYDVILIITSYCNTYALLDLIVIQSREENSRSRSYPHSVVHGQLDGVM